MNLEKHSLKGNFWRFVWPSVVAQWIFALYTMVDGLFVSRGVSEVALSAVNIASPYTNFLFSVSILFAVGASTIIAIYLGQGKREKANQIYSQNLVALGILSLVIMAAVWLNLDRIADFLGATEVNRHYVKEYIGSLVPFSWCFTMAYLFEILVKTDGYPKFATMAVTTGALLNCVLDYTFIFIFHWGVFGAGFATGISQCVVVMIYLVHFLGPKATIKFRRFHWNMKEQLRTVRNGTSSFLTELSSGITVLLFNHAILKYIGNDGIISYTIVAYVSTIVVMSMAGVGQGAQPLISFYYGRSEKKICDKLYRYGLISCAAIGAAAVLFAAAGGSLLVNVFISADMEQLRLYSVQVFRIFSLSFLICGFNVMTSGYFTAMERTKYAMIITLGRGLVILAAALTVCTLLWGGAGIWWSPLVSELVCLAVTAVLLNRFQKS